MTFIGYYVWFSILLTTESIQPHLDVNDQQQKKKLLSSAYREFSGILGRQLDRNQRVIQRPPPGCGFPLEAVRRAYQNTCWSSGIHMRDTQIQECCHYFTEYGKELGIPFLVLLREDVGNDLPTGSPQSECLSNDLQFEQNLQGERVEGKSDTDEQTGQKVIPSRAVHCHG